MQDQDSPEPAGPAPPVDRTPPTEPYEFSDEDNVLFKGLAIRMSSLGFLLLILAALDMPSLLRGEGRAALMATLFAVTGAWSFYTAYSVRSIVETEGSDISHLMAALTSLLPLLTMGVVVVLILVVLATSGTLVSLYDRFF